MSAEFSIAPTSERALSAGAYLVGALELALILGAVALAAWRVRATILPGWTGAPARLVEGVLAVAALIWLAELLGTFGAYGEATMIVASVALAGLAFLLCPRFDSRRSPRAPATPPAPPAAPLVIWIAAGACAVVAAAWMVPTLQTLAGGMDRADTLWYHMPLAARFADSGDLASIDYFDPIFFASYYPANSEALHSIGILAFGRDIVSPLLNLVFLVGGLLASYCIGRPYGLGPQALIGGSIALGAEMLVEFQAGEALNDIVGVAFVLAAVAVLVNEGAARAATGAGASLPALAVAGIAAGLAAGTKLSFLAPALALFVGVIAISQRGHRLRAATGFGLGAIAGGGYWYLRNLIAVGNPIPYSDFGPLNLPSPERMFEIRKPYSVSHYFGDTEVWTQWFFPGLSDAFGFLFPLVILAFAGAGALALWRGGEPLLRMLGAVVLVTAVAYLFTPLTAAGEEGEPIAFEWNVRYLAASAAIGLALIPCLPMARATERARRITLAVLVVLFVSTVVSLVQWKQGHVKGAVATAVIVLAGFAVLRWASARERAAGERAVPRRWALGAGAAAVLVALGAGWWEQNHYLERRYENLSPDLKLAETVRWARDLRDAKIALGGIRGVFNQYAFYGTDLSNHVQWLGEEGPDGAYLRIPTCDRWRQALADGDYTHVVTTYDPFDPRAVNDTTEGVWTREDPAARQLLREGPVSVFELTGEPDPSGCDGLPRLSSAELNGDSVNGLPRPSYK